MAGEYDVVVIGDVMLDRAIYLATGQHVSVWPSSPYTMLGHRDFPGGAANVAANASAMGATTRLVTYLGCDEEAVLLRDALYRAGVDFARDEPTGMVTTLKVRHYCNGVVLRYDRDGFVPERAPGHYLASMLAVAATSPPFPVFCFSDYAKGTFTNMTPWQDLLGSCNASMSIYLVDPSRQGKDWSKFAGPAALYKINRQQAHNFVLSNPHLLRDRLIDMDQIVQAGPCHGSTLVEYARLVSQVMVESGVPHRFLWLTYGDMGSVIGMAGLPRQWFSIPAYPSSGIDPLGAGDTCLATLAAHMASERNFPGSLGTIRDGCLRGSIAASLVCSHEGTLTASKEEVDRAYAGRAVVDIL